MIGVGAAAGAVLAPKAGVPMAEGIWQHRPSSDQHGRHLFDRGRSSPFGPGSVQDGAWFA